MDQSVPHRCAWRARGTLPAGSCGGGVVQLVSPPGVPAVRAAANGALALGGARPAARVRALPRGVHGGARAAGVVAVERSGAGGVVVPVRARDAGAVARRGAPSGGDGGGDCEPAHLGAHAECAPPRALSGERGWAGRGGAVAGRAQRLPAAGAGGVHGVSGQDALGAAGIVGERSAARTAGARRGRLRASDARDGAQDSGTCG